MATAQINEQEARTQQVFSALLSALSYPGREQRLPQGGQKGFLAIAETLIDLETSYYTPDTQLDLQLARLGAHAQPPALARYQFYPYLDPTILEELQTASVGSYSSPDEAATLVVGCAFTAGTWLELAGPGIQLKTSVLVDGIPAEFWTLRAEKCRYPLGWDIFLVSGNRVIGLPRTTRLEVK